MSVRRPGPALLRPRRHDPGSVVVSVVIAVVVSVVAVIVSVVVAGADRRRRLDRLPAGPVGRRGRDGRGGARRLRGRRRRARRLAAVGAGRADLDRLTEVVAGRRRRQQRADTEDARGHDRQRGDGEGGRRLHAQHAARARREHDETPMRALSSAARSIPGVCHRHGVSAAASPRPSRPATGCRRRGRCRAAG
ncbi:MHYT domain-containing protein [Jiangella endophytica]|uniref:MHYT domain-containing protein n=1 Tax=Jiangella endophytica TaxID=1623398 RepID=UPI000E355BA3